ncbi:MAG: CsgG/HfaB family protein [Desulfobacterales bacterium]
MIETGLRRGMAALCVGALLIFYGCAGTPVSPGVAQPAEKSGVTVAVWNLENLSISPGQGQDMEEFLTAKVLETLKNESNYEVVEREKLLLALEELNIGSSAMADQNTGLRIGRIIGAQLMVFGAYQVIGDTMRVDLRLVDVENGKIIFTATKTSPAVEVTGWLKAAEDAAAMLF